MVTHIFSVKCVTDMHVGDGEANYSIIDNRVQKDTVLQDVPIIHASGVKGALKEHFVRIWKDVDNKTERLKTIFGDSGGMGEYKFFNAVCLARPLRVTKGEKPYVLATSPEILRYFSELLKSLGREELYEKLTGSPTDEKTEVEVEGVNKRSVKISLLEEENSEKEDFVVIDDLRDYDLPVRARNVLDENGISKNLWYEELVPHKSIFIFAVMVPDNDSYYKDFIEGIKDTTVQFGGNASIGNGYTKITEVI